MKAKVYDWEKWNEGMLEIAVDADLLRVIIKQYDLAIDVEFNPNVEGIFSSSRDYDAIVQLIGERKPLVKKLKDYLDSIEGN